jgi:hypothetical protein
MVPNSAGGLANALRAVFASTGVRAGDALGFISQARSARESTQEDDLGLSIPCAVQKAAKAAIQIAYRFMLIVLCALGRLRCSRGTRLRAN